MIKKIKILLIFFFVGFFLTSCQTLKDGLEGNKKSKGAEEFLINKKNPLVLPPDFTKLPTPSVDENEFDFETLEIEDLLKKNSLEDNIDLKKTTTLEKSILEEIKKN